MIHKVVNYPFIPSVIWFHDKKLKGCKLFRAYKHVKKRDSQQWNPTLIEQIHKPYDLIY